MSDRPALDQVRVLSFGTALAGNDCAQMLAMLGADVVKIESRTRPDLTRALPFGHYSRAQEPTGVPVTAFHAGLTHSVRNLSLNMADERARAIFLRLAAECDVVVNNFTPSIMPRWGIDYDVLGTANPRLVMVSMPGLGKTGPKNFWLTVGGIVEAYVGLARLGSQGHGQHYDYVASTHAVFAVLIALRERARSGRGMFVDLAQSESGAAFLGPELLAVSVNAKEPGPPGNWVEGSAFSGVFRCGDPDSWLAVEAETEDDWRTMCATVAPDAASDVRFATAELRRRNLPALTAMTEVWTRRHTAHQAMRLLLRAGVPAGVVQNGEDLYRDPQLRSRAFIKESRHQDLGWSELPTSTFRLAKTPGRIRHSSRRLGEDNGDVLGSIGLGADEVEALVHDGVL